MEDKIAYFDLRANYKRFHIDTTGYWSYPIFVRNKADEILWLYIVLKSRTDTQTNTHFLFRPHAIVVTPPNSKQIIKFESLKYGHDPFPNLAWEKALGSFPHHDIQNMTVKDFRENEHRLLQLCKENTKSLTKQNNVSDEFKNLWKKMTNPIFFKFIECFSPEFYEIFKKKSDEMKW